MKIALIGRVAEKQELFDGQTIKTRNIYNLLKSIEDAEDVILVDTYRYKYHVLKVLIQTVNALRVCDKIVLSISINGRKFFFPFLYYTNKLFKKDIYHCLIGGRLASNIAEHPSWKKYVSSFKVNWVESHELVENLRALNVYNGEYFPNFKDVQVLKESELIYHMQKPYMFCTFSRVQKQKGIADAIGAIDRLNRKNGSTKAILDIYGPVDESFKEEFEQLISSFDYCVNYKGCVNANRSVDTIKKYFALLFPTRYFNEGIPGTIIDALSAGVPIIARKWHYCDEMLEDKVTGLIYEFDKPDGLEKCIDTAIENSAEFMNMKKNCIEKACEYTRDKAKDIVLGGLKK